MLAPALRDLAKRQLRDYQALTPGTYFGEAEESSLALEDAYTMQMEVARLRCASGDAVAGYKVGCIGLGVVEQFGMSGPIHGRVFRSELRASGDTLSASHYANRAIEGEMAVRIGADGRIEVAFPVIELHHFVFRGASKTLAELVANNGINAGAVIPQPLSSTVFVDWVAARVPTVEVNGKPVDSGPLWAMPGGAEEAVRWLSGDLRRFGVSLMPGDIVLTGTPLRLHPVRPGDYVAILIDGTTSVLCNVA